MKRAYKVEINPTPEQIVKIHQTIGVCRFIYNSYIAYNKEVYEKENKFISGYDYSKYINNIFIKENQDKLWIKDVSSKAVKQSIMNGEKAFKNFFKGLSDFPKYKKKSKKNTKAYFPKNNKTDYEIQRHRIKVPTIGWVKLKEFGYVPTNSIVKSGSISQRANRYYLSILVEEEVIIPSEPLSNGVGIDLGIKELAIVSNGDRFKNINKTNKVRRLEKRLKHHQRKLSRKYESLKKNKKEGGATRQNIQKQKVKVQKYYKKLDDIRTDFLNKSISQIIKQKPSFITIENLKVKNLMKNKHLSKAIASMKWFEFRTKLTYKCKLNNIELRVVDTYFPSTKTCSNCGNINKNITLKDRTYKCDCGLCIDRDLNASLVLKNAKKYKIA